jgi:hypothetical protein
LGYLDQGGNRVKSESGYTISIDQLIDNGWLKPEIFLAEDKSHQVASGSSVELERLRAENQQLKELLTEANIRLKVREEDIERLNSRLVELESKR